MLVFVNQVKQTVAAFLLDRQPVIKCLWLLLCVVMFPIIVIYYLMMPVLLFCQLVFCHFLHLPSSGALQIISSFTAVACLLSLSSYALGFYSLCWPVTSCQASMSPDALLLWCFQLICYELFEFSVKALVYNDPVCIMPAFGSTW